MMCRDNKPCDYWYTADGAVVCRHGVCAEAADTTEVDFKCPADLMYAGEKEKWEQFMKDWPMIQRRLRTSFQTTKEET